MAAKSAEPKGLESKPTGDEKPATPKLANAGPPAVKEYPHIRVDFLPDGNVRITKCDTAGIFSNTSLPPEMIGRNPSFQGFVAVQLRTYYDEIQRQIQSAVK